MHDELNYLMEEYKEAVREWKVSTAGDVDLSDPQRTYSRALEAQSRRNDLRAALRRTLGLDHVADLRAPYHPAMIV